MPSRTKLIKHTALGTNTPMEKVEISGWERSKISNQDHKTLKKLGLLKKHDSLIFPGDESFSCPPIGYRVTFIDHLIRGLSTPIHEFLRGLLFVYGIQLHQLTPNSILHISIFITLCECFLGTHPHWGLRKRIFYLWRNNSRNVVYNVGGVCICARPDVDYFDVKFPDSVQGWRRRRRSWDAEATAEEKTATEALMKRIHQLQNTHGEELSGVQITLISLGSGCSLCRLAKTPFGCGEVDERAIVTDDSQESSRPESEVAGSHKSTASFEKETKSDPSESGRSVSPPLAVSPRNKRKRDEVEDSGTSKPSESAPEETSHEEEGAFNPYDDAGSVNSARRKNRKNPKFMENLKVGVEGTIALVADSRKDVDWAKAGDPKGMNKTAASGSTAKPEVK
ncbi:hypothetical protein QYE76_025847 [Lolium multiflorum]|uniref:Transposase (putative) gypsy type domain-containing protein n=1 Tax=Lolium multiflorum TaxID=4521 RepID=A0AAD8VX08_LOLMU|nr:hypothetical protein QYE76_025847 [Lolium multiflorum]